MPLVSGTNPLLDARKRGYAIPQFNVLNLEMVEAVISIAEESNSPVIIGIVDRHFPSLNVESLIFAIKKRASVSKIPVILHLDHGTSWKRLMEAIKLGFTSIMFDGSLLPVEENIKITNNLKQCADPLGISVEAEIGHVGKEGRGNQATSVNEAISFIKETRVDYLAISIGNTHGHTRATNFNFNVLGEIYEKVNIPLVLHGGSDISEVDAKKLIRNGISKVNIFSEFAEAYLQGILKWGKNDVKDYLNLTHHGKEKSKRVVLEKLETFKTKGKANNIVKLNNTTKSIINKKEEFHK